VSTERSFWLAVASDVNCSALSHMNFPYYALGGMGRVLARTICPGDLCALYRTGARKGFIGIFEITEPVKDATTQVGSRIFPLRLPWKSLTLCEDAPVHARDLAPHLAFIRDKSRFGMYFQINIKRLNEKDFAVVERAVRSASQLRSGPMIADGDAQALEQRAGPDV
jgi:EVE domain